MSGDKSTYQKYIIITPAALKRIRGEGSLLPRLDAERGARLQKAAARSSSYEDFLNYQRALQKFLSRTEEEARNPLEISIGRDEAGARADATAAEAAAAAAAAAATAAAATATASKGTPARRTRGFRTRGSQTSPQTLRDPNARVRKATTVKTSPKTPQPSVVKGWLSYGRA